MYLHVKVPVPAKANALKEINAKIKAAVAKQPWRACERASEQAKNFTFAVNGAEAALQASLSFEYTNPPSPPTPQQLSHTQPFAIRHPPTAWPAIGENNYNNNVLTHCIQIHAYARLYSHTHTHTASGSDSCALPDAVLKTHARPPYGGASNSKQCAVENICTPSTCSSSS